MWNLAKDQSVPLTPFSKLDSDDKQYLKDLLEFNITKDKYQIQDFIDGYYMLFETTQNLHHGIEIAKQEKFELADLKDLVLNKMQGWFISATGRKYLYQTDLETFTER